MATEINKQSKTGLWLTSKQMRDHFKTYKNNEENNSDKHSEASDGHSTHDKAEQHQSPSQHCIGTTKDKGKYKRRLSPRSVHSSGGSGCDTNKQQNQYCSSVKKRQPSNDYNFNPKSHIGASNTKVKSPFAMVLEKNQELKGVVESKHIEWEKIKWEDEKLLVTQEKAKAALKSEFQWEKDVKQREMDLFEKKFEDEQELAKKQSKQATIMAAIGSSQSASEIESIVKLFM
ncbi:hypothetical protein BY996DRAFT_6929822 [Phakopsora pachyrhizi]|nr:hypothetical protein BY996DRAFT_6929822 [Phakopsora pachyrhizi]